MTMLNDIDLPKGKMVDMKFITELTGLSDKWIYKQISLRKFPKQIKLGSNSRWYISEVLNWLDEREQESRGA